MIALNEAKPRFRAPFYYLVASGLLFFGGFAGRSPVEMPGLCGVALLFSLVGMLMARTVTTRCIGVILVGLTGGFLAAYLRARYF